MRCFLLSMIWSTLSSTEWKKHQVKAHISNANIEKERNAAGGHSGDQDASAWWWIRQGCTMTRLGWRKEWNAYHPLWQLLGFWPMNSPVPDVQWSCCWHRDCGPQWVLLQGSNISSPTGLWIVWTSWEQLCRPCCMLECLTVILGWREHFHHRRNPESVYILGIGRILLLPSTLFCLLLKHAFAARHRICP